MNYERGRFFIILARALFFFVPGPRCTNATPCIFGFPPKDFWREIFFWGSKYYERGGFLNILARAHVSAEMHRVDTNLDLFYYELLPGRPASGCK